MCICVLLCRVIRESERASERERGEEGWKLREPQTEW